MAKLWGFLAVFFMVLAVAFAFLPRSGPEGAHSAARHAGFWPASAQLQ